MALTPKQEKFAQVYVKTGNASEAYRQAYNAEKWEGQSVHVEASKSLAHTEISLRIAQLQDYARRRNEATADKVIAEFAKLAFLDARKAFDADGNLKPMHEIDDDTAAAISGFEFEERFEKTLEPGDGFVPGKRKHVGRNHKIKFADKLKALEGIGRSLGLFLDRTEVSGSLEVSMAQVIREARAKRLGIASCSVVEGVKPEENRDVLCQSSPDMESFSQDSKIEPEIK